jgi:hypothetical protein
MANQGGSHEQHVKAGEQRHKNTSGDSDKLTRGGSHEQHVKLANRATRTAKAKS